MTNVPEQYLLTPTEHCPNNKLPALIYRNVLPQDPDEEITTEFLERYSWEKRGTWGAITTRHFHPNTHECYGIFRGESTLRLGAGGGDPDCGVTVDVRTGDVVVVPAGVAHCSVTASSDYKYIGVYPKESPRWRNEWGKEPVDHAAFQNEISAVPIPSNDPVVGPDGHLSKIWTDTAAKTSQS